MFAYTQVCFFRNARDGKLALIRADRGEWIDAGGNTRSIDGNGSNEHIANFLKQVGAYSPLYYAVQDGRVVALSSSQLDSINALIELKTEYEEYIAVLTEDKLLWVRSWAHKEEPNVIGDIAQNYPPYECPWTEDRDGIVRTTELPRGWYLHSWVGASHWRGYHHHAILSHRDATMIMTVASEFHRSRQHLMTRAAHLHSNAEELFRQVFHGGNNDITF